MNEYDLCEELEGVYQDDVFQTPTLSYRLNAFIDAYGMDLEKGGIEDLGNINFGKLYESNQKYFQMPICDIVEKKSSNGDYIITIMNTKSKKVSWVKIEGKYLNTEFSFDNYYTKSIKSDEIYEIPFSLSIIRQVDDYNYRMDANQDGLRTVFKFSYSNADNILDYDEIEFYVNRNDIENVFSIMSLFLDNPNYVFNTYKNVI